VCAGTGEVTSPAPVVVAVAGTMFHVLSGSVAYAAIVVASDDYTSNSPGYLCVQAFASTLITLKMTLEDLDAMPELVKALLSYHLTASTYSTAASLVAAGTVETLVGLPLEIESAMPAEKCVT
jgi:hypothetical protein